MNKHLPLAVLRLIIAYGIVRVMPFTHSRFGRQYPGDGQQAYGFIVILLCIGLAAAALYIVAASLLHIVRRRGSWLDIFGVDVILGACFAGALAYFGVTASFSDTPGGRSGSVTIPSDTRRR